MSTPADPSRVSGARVQPAETMQGRAAAPAAARPRGRGLTHGRGPRRWWERPDVMPYLLIAPAILFELLVHFVPMVAGVVMSFYKLTLFTLHHWSPVAATIPITQDRATTTIV